MTEKQIKLIIDVPEDLVCEGFERPFTDEERQILIRAIENGTLYKENKGEWIIVDDTEQFIAKCSVCGRSEDSRMIKDYPFCHCGAKMSYKKR